MLAMRKTLRILALTLALSCSVYAGDIPHMVNGTPPPPPEELETTASGDIPHMPPGTIEAAAINLLQSLLTLV